MKIIAYVPIKMNNERLPGKNTKLLGEKPLIQYILDSLYQVDEIDQIYVYCSREEIQNYYKGKATFLKRPTYLDLSTSNFTQIFEQFMNTIDSDIYILAHATAPFIQASTIKTCIEAVKSGKYDSAFTATEVQDYLWQNGTPLNFDAANLPRSQDLNPIYRETSGIYVFRKEVFRNLKRRIGEHPFIKVLTMKEAVDINVPEDMKMAELFLKQENE